MGILKDNDMDNNILFGKKGIGCGALDDTSVAWETEKRTSSFSSGQGTKSGKLIEEFTIPSYLTDSSRRLSPASTLAVAQDLSYKGGDELGIGDKEMSARGLAWVLCRARFIVERAPEMFEDVILETWHKGLSGPYFIRNYRIRDTAGRELVRVTSSCVLIDKENRALTRVDHILGNNSFEPLCGECTFDVPAEKIRILQGEYDSGEVVRTIEYTDTDFVGHTNNINYLKWAMDCEALNGGMIHPRDVTVNYIQETSAGDRITFRRMFSDGVSYLTGVVNGRCVMTVRLAC